MMLEKQRIHLEGLIDELVDASLFASDCDGTDFAGSAIEAKEKAGDRVKEYLDLIQSFMGAVLQLGAFDEVDQPGGGRK